MSNKKQLLLNTIVLGIGRLSSQAISLLLLPVYTAFLTTDEYGLVDLVITYVALLSPLIIVQLDRSAFRFLIESRTNDAEVGTIITSTLNIVAPILILAVLLIELAGYILNLPYQHLIAGVLLSSTLSMLGMQFSRGLGKNIVFTIASLISGLVTLVGIIGLVVYLGLAVSGVFWSNIIANIFVIIYLIFALKLFKYISFSYISISMQKKLLSFAWPLVPSAVSWWLIRSFDRTIIVIMLGVAANGIYAAASKYALIFFMIYSIFDLAWTEAASKEINSKDKDKFFSEVFNASFRAFGAFGLLLIAITPYVFNILIGDDFHDAYSLIPVLIVGVLLQTMVGQFSAVYIAKKATKEILLTSFVAAGTSLMLNILLIKPLGLMGPAVSLIIAFFAMTIWRHYDMKKFVTIKYDGLIFLQLLALYATAIIIFYMNSELLNAINLLIAVIATVIMTASIWKVAGEKVKNTYDLYASRS